MKKSALKIQLNNSAEFVQYKLIKKIIYWL